MNSTFNISNVSRYLRVAFPLIALFLTQVHAQPRLLSLEIQRLDFNGNLLKFPDGTFLAERVALR